MANIENPLLSEQIDLLNKILAGSTDHIYVFDRAGRYLYANPAGLAALRLQASDVLGKNWCELNFPADVMQRHDAQRESVFQTGIAVKGETSFPTVQGVRHYEYVISPILGENGEIDAVINTSRDITERKQAEDSLRLLTEQLETRFIVKTEELTTLNQSLKLEIAERQKVEQALKESQMSFQSLVNAMFEGIVVQENGKIIDANPRFAKMFGYSLEEVIGKSAVDFLTPKSLQIVLHQIETQYELPYEITGIRKDGTLINLEVVGKQSLYQGRSVRVSAARDITERKRAEAALRDRQNQIQRQLAEIETIYQSAPIGLNVLDTELRFVRINQRLAEMNGLPIEAHIGHTIRELLPDLADTAEQLLRPILETGEPLLNVEITGETPAQPGVKRTWLESFLPLKDGDRIIGISTVCEEITARKQAEIALREKEQQLQQLCDSMPQFVWICNAQGETEYVNRQWLEYSGLTVEQSRNPQKVAEFHHPEEVQAVSEQWAIALATKQPFEIEARLKRASDGAYRWFLIRAVPVLDQQGQVLRWYGTSTDIHDRKQDQLNEQFLNELDLQLRQLSTSEAMVQEAVSRLGSYLNIDRCLWDRVDTVAGISTIEYDWRQPGVPSIVGTYRISEFMLPELVDLFNAGQSAVISDILLCPYTAPFAQNLLSLNIRAFIGIPCIYEGRWVATLKVTSQTIRQWRSDEVALLQAIVARLWSIIEQTRAVQALQEQEERTRLATEAAALGMWFWNITQNELVWTDRCKALFGLARDEQVSYEVFLNVLHPDDRDFTHAAVTQALKQKVEYNVEYRTMWSDGSIHWIAAKGRAFYDTNGQPTQMMGTVQDISDRKLVEQELQSVYDSLNLALGAAKMGTWDLDLITDTARRNLRHDQIFGYDTLQPEWGHEIAKRHALPEDLPNFDRGFQQGLRTGKVEFDARVIWPDQSLHWINVLGRVYYNEQHQPVRMAGVVMDITDRKQAAAALQERESLLQLFAQYAPAGIAMFDQNMCYVMASQRWVEDYQLGSLESLIGRSHYEIFPEIPERWRQIHQRCLAGAIEKCDEDLFVRADGTQQWIRWELHPWHRANHEIGGIIIFSEDITQRKQAEQRLKQKKSLLRLFAQYAPVGIAMFDEEMRYLMVSQRWVDDYYHGSPESLIGRSQYEAFPEVPERWRQIHQRCLAGAIEKCDEDLFVRADGTQQWTRWEIRPWYTATDKIGGIIIFAEDITERKQAEASVVRLNQELQQKVTELQTLLDVIPIGIGIAEDPECQHIRVNPAFAEALGIPPTINASLSAPEEERPTSFKVYQNGRELAAEELPLQYSAKHGVEVRDLEVEVVWQDGTTVTLLEYAAPLLDEYGQPRGSVGAFLNITERKLAEQALQDNEHQLKLALQAAKAGAWTWQLKTNQLYWSDEYYRVFGLEPGSVEPSYENGFSRLHPEDREWVERETAEAIAQGKNTNVEYRILLPDGSFRWVIGIGQMFYDELEQPISMAGIVVDITERKQVEAELRKREELYRVLAQNFPNGAVHIFDRDLRYLLSDGTEMRKVGLTQEQLEGHTLWEAVPPETCAVLEPLYRAALSGETTSAELLFADQVYQIYTLPLRNEQGEIFAGLSMSQNVTLLKQAEQTLVKARDELERQVQERTRELRQANEMLQLREREFRTLVENTPDMISRHDRQYRYLYVNPARIRLASFPPEFYLGKKPSELGYSEELTRFWETSLESVFVTGEMRSDEFSMMTLNESRIYQVKVVPERDANNSIVSVMTIGRDITQLRQAEKSAQKLAEELQRSNQELEQFAYVASHDLQEPLRAITSFTQMLAKRYQGQLDAKADTYIEFIVDGATRMQQLIRDLLAYSRAGRYELKLQPVDCNALLERVKKDLQVAIAENRAVITADFLPTITADPNQMGNLLQNLIGNSLKYRSEADPRMHISAKIITLEVSRTSNQDGFPRLTTPVREWLFSIQDNGIGIEPQYAERIFGIFQRLHTSDEYPGTGLGLAICRKIIERHEGRIWVESQLGQGATFFFTIPICMRT